MQHGLVCFEMAETAKRLKAKRAGHKGSVTKLTKNLPERLNTESDDVLQALHRTLKSKIICIKEIDEQIADVLSEIDAEALEDEIIMADEYAICNESFLISLENRLGSNRSGGKPAGVKLPTLTLPKFDGNPIEWTGFWDLFHASIHIRSDLSAMQKFAYLRGQLVGEPKQLLDGFSVEAKNYDPSVKLLQDTYGRPDRVKAAHISTLLNLPAPAYTANDLKQFRASFESGLRSLGTLETSIDEVYTVILIDKLPSPFKEVIKRESKDKWLDLSTFKESYMAELRNVEMSSESLTSQFEHGSASTAAFQVQSKQKNHSHWEKPKANSNPKDSKYNSNQGQRYKKRVPIPVCVLCSEGHWWDVCPKYKSVEARLNRAEDRSLCKNCLRFGANHECSFYKFACDNTAKCGKTHHVLLCPHKDKKQVQSGIKTMTLSVPSGQDTVILPTVSLPLNSKGRTYDCRALLDQCSQRTFVAKEVLPHIDHKYVGRESLKLQGFTGTQDTKTYDVVSLTYIDDAHVQCSFDAVVVDHMPDHQKLRGLDTTSIKLQNLGYKLADPNLGKCVGVNKIQILIGADTYYSIVKPGYKKLDNIILIPTTLGYALSGSAKLKNVPTNVEMISVLKVSTTLIDHYVTQTPTEIDPQDILSQLWELDHIGISSNELDRESVNVLEKFENSVAYSKNDQQYVVGLPWKENCHELPSNIGLARGRLKNLQNRFQKDPKFCENYNQVIKETENRGFIEKVDLNENPIGVCHYLSHHGVVKDSKTTPLRIVYDCSARMSKSSVSLNDCLFTGPSLISDLTKVLLRFRLNKYACLSDIEKAFLMLQLDERDRDATRFFWPEDPLDINSPLIHYRFRVVLFGATCSQFLLNATILKHLSTLKIDPNLITKFKRGLYVDNLLGTDNSEQNLLKFYQTASKSFSEAHLNLREWVTNSPLLEQEINSHSEKPKNHSHGEKSYEEKPVDIESVKFLGMLWNPEFDTLTLKSRLDDEIPDISNSKRSVLSKTAQIFDPLGMILPVTIRSRILLQELWRRKLSWDEPIPEDLVTVWQVLLGDLRDCFGCQIPRQLVSSGTVELHAFSDASNVAYGSVIYFALNGISRFVIAKAKVAPIKPISVPKLELTAVLLSARLSKYVLEAYENELEFSAVHLWCDSQIDLYWLTSDKVLPVYVRNRVDEISSLLPDVLFHYVPSKENPSDLVTRGVTSKELRNSSLWWEGPSWLPDPSSWPTWKGHLEVGSSHISVVNITDEAAKETPVPMIQWDRFNSYEKVVRVIGWVKRFITNLKDKGRMQTTKTTKKKHMGLTQDYLNCNELRSAERLIVNLIQMENYCEVIDQLRSKQGKPSKLVMQLGLYLDNGILHCKGRLEKSELPQLAKYPVLLPKSHVVTFLLVESTHKLNAHYGLNYVVAKLRQRWWIPRIRQVVRKVLRKCITCKKLQCRSYSYPKNPPLPEFRVKRADPFQVTGVDYTGAICVKDRAGHLVKVYILLFTCAVTRAIHLELVQDQSCEKFLNAFRRFCGRRSFPQIIMSDNAATFVSAANYLKEMYEKTQVQEHLASIRCQWKFIPARSPWFGAIWERLIGTVKSGLKKILGRAVVTADELNTLLVDVETFINDRPLTYVSGDVDEPLPLTPSHLLQGRRLRSFPEEILTEEDLKDPGYLEPVNVSRRYQYVLTLKEHFWRRWTTEYLASLRESYQTHNKAVGTIWPEIGDIVLIHDDGPRLHWRLGRVSEVYQGISGLPRVAQLKTSTGLTTRATCKLYPLELQMDDSSVSDDGVGAGVDGIADRVVHANNAPSAIGSGNRLTRKAALSSMKAWQSRITSGQL